jgi:hypothetical protein
MIKKLIKSMVSITIELICTYFIEYLRIEFYCFEFLFLMFCIISILLRFDDLNAFVHKMEKNEDDWKTVEATCIFLLMKLILCLITPTYKLQILNKIITKWLLRKSKYFSVGNKSLVEFIISVFVN